MRTKKSPQLQSRLIDRRALTSSENGKKGGRPRVNSIRKEIHVTTTDTLAGMRINDYATGLERAIRRAFPKSKVHIQTNSRMSLAGINYDHHAVNDLLTIDGIAIKFNWEMKTYMKSFVNMTKGAEDYRFFLKVPKMTGGNQHV